MKLPVVKLPTLACLRCGHRWHPRKDASPLRCPKCKNPYWNRKRERKTEKKQ
jgi:predicted Zn-ribbon and HTH transcriptional regulator